ncbi:D-hexose-6-phosphate mutarotase [Cutibacterium equinum]|uniref:D-hexose-6-phosphate mutarotase n=1 Tax=Cutibacterium equinum TaxID=3016342 RepID=A0ABY7QYT8_9ACTN|nr:D-hexose-6-phosphate mutarotase [Cutibacterium equinum]WCC79692.1 D-hexose-6-phosphate mutarotase [Cutibacterium equinum]
MTNLLGNLHSAHDGTWQVAEHGCQVLAWQADDKPVIWFDAAHTDESDAVIRGGIPLCAPWFGHGPNNDQDPQHGLARRTDFQVTAAEPFAESFAEPFQVVGTAETDSIEIRHEVVMTDTRLKMTLTLTNRDDQPRTVEGMWHTYLRVKDAEQARVRGVKGADWHNFATGDKGFFDAGELVMAPDTDTVLQGVGPELTLVDPAWGREIHLATTHCPSAVIWNPRSSSGIGDSPTARAWRDFVCVETGVCKDNAITLEPEGDLVLTTTISVTTL